MPPLPLAPWALAVCAVLIPAACVAGAQAPVEAAPGEAAYHARCAACHTGQGKDMGPALEAMRRMSYAQIRFAVTRGKMREHARGLGREEFGALVAFVAGDSAADTAGASLCADWKISLDATVPGWGFDPANTRFQGDTAIDEENVASLELAWAFGLPDVAEGRSHPVVTSDTVFVAAVSGYVFALDRDTGCTKWRHAVGTPVRTPLSLGRTGPRDALFFGDVSSTVHAVDALTGAPIWTWKVGLFDASVLTGGIAQHEGTLFVPVSAFGVALARNPEYECCKSHGAVRALDAATGEIRWTRRMTPPAEKTYRSDVGTQMWGPSGAAVWTTPTVDGQRGRIYIGTGENTSTPATDLSDAIVALDMQTGEIAWSFQATAGDAFNMACGFRKGPSCPKEDGPDFDFGATPVLTRLPDGRDILVAGQKSGVVHALDADDGTVLWQTRLSDGTALGGVHWGIAVANGRVVVPIADPEFPLPGYTPRPGCTRWTWRRGKSPGPTRRNGAVTSKARGAPRDRPGRSVPSSTASRRRRAPRRMSRSRRRSTAPRTRSRSRTAPSSGRTTPCGRTRPSTASTRTAAPSTIRASRSRATWCSCSRVTRCSARCPATCCWPSACRRAEPSGGYPAPLCSMRTASSVSAPSADLSVR